MMRIAFIGEVSSEWMGGLNYYKNLLYAISIVEKNVKVIVFVGKNTDNDIKDMFSEYADVIEDSMFDKKTLKWYLWKLLYKFFNSTYFLDKLLKTHDIQVLSHSGIIGLKECKTINWIPDFQHLHLPHMFSKKNILGRDKVYLEMIKKSDKIVVSSYAALKDFKSFAPQYIEKVDVLPFVSQPDQRYLQLSEDKKSLIEKYNLSEEFFYIPNQFWKHKNHMLVFEAVKILKDKNVEINIVCTGHLNDSRNLEYIEIIKEYITSNNLQNNITLLGLVDYKDVFALMKFSIAVINPSLFEGWSSTVEECKSVGKNMILSDLDVHKEQYPSAIFFDRMDEKALVKVLGKDTFNHEIQDYALLEQSKKFGNNYLKIVNKII